ncbi:MAG: hypothetical protein LBR67_09050 [Dysgonamonadaceae bacterium]|jgi:hypothetical protein|nr:hypothetical protein [Dysgonamonadaceae bacterium]
MKEESFKTGLMILTLALFAVACGSKDKQKDPISSLEKEITKKLDAKQTQSAGWPDNEYTKVLPKPDIKCGASGSSVLGFSVTFDKTTIEKVKEYAEKVKKAGFTANAFESGGDSYMYSAENEAGYSVLLSWADGQAGVLISKPKSK